MTLLLVYFVSSRLSLSSAMAEPYSARPTLETAWSDYIVLAHGRTSLLTLCIHCRKNTEVKHLIPALTEPPSPDDVPGILEKVRAFCHLFVGGGQHEPVFIPREAEAREKVNKLATEMLAICVTFAKDARAILGLNAYVSVQRKDLSGPLPQLLRPGEGDRVENLGADLGPSLQETSLGVVQSHHGQPAQRKAFGGGEILSSRVQV